MDTHPLSRGCYRGPRPQGLPPPGWLLCPGLVSGASGHGFGGADGSAGPVASEPPRTEFYDLKRSRRSYRESFRKKRLAHLRGVGEKAYNSSAWSQLCNYKTSKTSRAKNIEILELKFSFVLHVSANLTEVLLRSKEIMCVNIRGQYKC